MYIRAYVAFVPTCTIVYECKERYGESGIEDSSAILSASSNHSEQTGIGGQPLLLEYGDFKYVQYMPVGTDLLLQSFFMDQSKLACS